MRLSEEQMWALKNWVSSYIDEKIDQAFGRLHNDSSYCRQVAETQLENVLQQGYGDDE